MGPISPTLKFLPTFLFPTLILLSLNSLTGGNTRHRRDAIDDIWAAAKRGYQGVVMGDYAASSFGARSCSQAIADGLRHCRDQFERNTRDEARRDAVCCH